MTALRRSSRYSEVMVYGAHELVLPDDEEVYAYLRSGEGMEILVISNFSDQVVKRNLDLKPKGIIISNYAGSPLDLDPLILRPYESVANELQ